MATLTISTDISASGLRDTSSSAFTMTIGATANLTVSAGKSWVAGMNLGLYPQGTPLLTPLACSVISYSGNTLLLNCTAFGPLAGGIVGAVSSMQDRFAKQALSQTSNTVGTGSKTWQIRPGLNLTAGDGTTTGDQINIVSRTTQANRMFGRVTAYNNTTGSVTINCTSSTGAGTLTDWIFTSGGSVSSWIICILDGDLVDVTGFNTMTFDIAPWGCPNKIQAIAQGKIKHTNIAEADPIIVRLAGLGVIDVRNNGIYEAKSATYKTVGTGTGNALAITLSSAWDNLSYPTAVEVETVSGIGVYEQWQVYPSYIYGVDRFGYHYGCDLSDVWVGTLGGTNTGAVANTAYTVTGGTGTGGQFYALNVSSGNIQTGYMTKGVGYSINDVLTIQAGNNAKTYTVTELGNFGGTGPLNKVVIWDPLNHRLLFGDGTTGTAVPNGAKVRIPNCVLEGLPQEAPIIADLTTGSISATFESAAAITTFVNSQMTIDSEAMTTSAKTANAFTIARGIRSSMVASHPAGSIARNLNFASITSKCQINTNPGGTLDFDGFCTGENVSTQSLNAKSVTIKRFGCTASLSVGSLPGDVVIDGVSRAGDPYVDTAGTAGYPVTFVSVQGNLDCQNVTVGQATWNTTVGTGNIFFNAAGCSRISRLAYIRAAAAKMKRNDINTVTIAGCSFSVDGAMHDFDVVTRTMLYNMSNIRMYNIRHCSALMKGTAIPDSGAEKGLQCATITDSIFHNLGTVTGCQQVSSNPLLFDASSNNNFCHTCAYSGKWLGSARLGHLFDNRGTNNAFVNISSDAITDSSYYNYSNAGNTYATVQRMNNIRLGSVMTGATLYNSAQSEDDFVPGNTVSPSVSNLTDATWWHNMCDGGTLSPTTGRIGFGYGGPNKAKTQYSITGSIRSFCDNAGSLYLGDTGDVITFTNWSPLRGITSLQNVAVANYHTNWTNVTEEVRICPWGHDITAVSYVPLTIADLLTMWSAMVGYTSNAGLQIQVRYTAGSSLTNRKTGSVHILTNLDSSFSPPIGYVPNKASSCISGSAFCVIKNGISYGYQILNTTTGTAQVPYSFVGLLEPVTFRVIKLGYIPWEQSTSNNKTGSNVTVVPILDVYNTETSAAKVSAYTSIETFDKLHDANVNYNMTSTGINQKFIDSAVGGVLYMNAASLTVTPSVSSVYSYNYINDTVTIKSASISAGSKLTSINVSNTLNVTAAAFSGIFSGGSISIGSIGNYTFSTIGNVVINMVPSTTGTYYFNGTSTGIMDLRNLSSNAITVTIPNGSLYTTVNNTGGAITIANPPVSLTIQRPNIINGSNYIIKNNTQLLEIASGVVSGGAGISATFIKGISYNTNDILELRIGYCVGISAMNTIVEQIIAPDVNTTNNAPTTQVANSIYQSIAIDGSTRTEFTADYVQNDINVTIGVDFYGQNFMAWWIYNESTLSGLRNFLNGYTLIDQGNIRNNTSVLTILFDNNTVTNIKQIDNIRIYRSDGGYPVKNPSTSGGSIDINWREPVVVTYSGVSALTPAQIANLSLIPALL